MRTPQLAWWMGLAFASVALVSTNTMGAQGAILCCDAYGDAGCQTKSGTCPPASNGSIELTIPVVASPSVPVTVKTITSPPFRGFCLTGGFGKVGSTSLCAPGNSGCDPNAPQVPTQCIAVVTDGGLLQGTDFATVEVSKGLLSGSANSSHRFESCYTYSDGGADAQWNNWPNTYCQPFGAYCCTTTAELSFLSSGNGVAAVYPLADVQGNQQTNYMAMGSAGTTAALALGFLGRWARRRKPSAGRPAS